MGTEHSIKQDGKPNVASPEKVTSIKIKWEDPSNHTEYSVSKSKSCTISKSISTAFPSQYSTSSRIKPRPSFQFKDLDLTSIKNGITGKYISARVVKIAAQFWDEHISQKSFEDKLEIGCTIYFGMMVDNVELKRIFSANRRNKQSIENSSLKFVDMIGWLLRALCSNVNLLAVLQQLGIMHRNMGVCYNHFEPMLQSMHGTFAYYFPIKYGVQIKYAIDQIFTLTARVMSGQDLNEDNADDEDNKHEFLQSLNVCLASNVGREYFYRYLQQIFCDEIAIFLESLAKFKVATSDKERFMIARSIIKNSVEPTATFSVNISYETRTNVRTDMVELERIFFEKEDLKVSKDMFVVVEKEILLLIGGQHWRKFNQTFKNIEVSPMSTH